MAHTPKFALTCGLLLLSPAAANAAGGAPPQLYNKTIALSWSEGRTMKDPEGGTRHNVVGSEMVVYVSGSGRLFTQMARNVKPRNPKAFATTMSSASSRSADGDVIKTANVRYTRSMNFQGRSLVMDTQYESGARRISVDFDDSYRSCALNIIHGKDEGAPGLVMHGMNQKIHMLVSIEIAGQTCSVKDGPIE